MKIPEKFDRSTKNNPRSPKQTPLLRGMPMKIGVMGGASGTFTKDQLERAHEAGKQIAEHGCVLVTGACPGLPLAAARGAYHSNGLVVGISPALSLNEHVYQYKSPTDFHNVLIYTGSGLMGREVVNIRSSDMVVIIGGRSGTLGELSIAYDEGKLIGVLTGTGGISDMVKTILAACKKNTGAHVIYSKDPKKLIYKLIQAYQKVYYKHPSRFQLAPTKNSTKNPRPEMVRHSRFGKKPIQCSKLPRK